MVNIIGTMALPDQDALGRLGGIEEAAVSTPDA
jgi:hypothetical protein